MPTKNSFMLGICMLIISVLISFELAAAQENVTHRIARRELPGVPGSIAKTLYKWYEYYDTAEGAYEFVNWTLAQAENYVDQQCHNSKQEQYCCLNDPLLYCQQCCPGPQPQVSSLIYSPSPSLLPPTSSKLLLSFSWQLLSLTFIVMNILMGGTVAVFNMY